MGLHLADRRLRVCFHQVEDCIQVGAGAPRDASLVDVIHPAIHVVEVRRDAIQIVARLGNERPKDVVEHAKVSRLELRPGRRRPAHERLHAIGTGSVIRMQPLPHGLVQLDEPLPCHVAPGAPARLVLDVALVDHLQQRARGDRWLHAVGHKVTVELRGRVGGTRYEGVRWVCLTLAPILEELLGLGGRHEVDGLDRPATVVVGEGLAALDEGRTIGVPWSIRVLHHTRPRHHAARELEGAAQVSAIVSAQSRNLALRPARLCWVGMDIEPLCTLELANAAHSKLHKGVDRERCCWCWWRCWRGHPRVVVRAALVEAHPTYAAHA